MTEVIMIKDIYKSYPNFRGVCPNPVFIIGAPRSGTTALAWSLARHSQLWTSGESYILFDLFGEGGWVDRALTRAKSISPDGWLVKENVERDEFLGYLGIGVNALFASRSGGKRWIDHTPHYALITDILSKMFPGAIFLHILRDGRNVVRSMVNFQKRLVRGQVAETLTKAFVPPWANDFREACKTWRRYVEAAKDFERSQPLRCLTVRNEDLVADPEQGFQRLCEFIRISYERAPAEFFSTTRLNSSFPKNPAESVSPATFPNPWESWTAEQQMMFLDEAGATMLMYGLATEAELWIGTEAIYQRLVARIREVAEANLPAVCTVAVISKGDDELLNLQGRTAWHLPRGDDGFYAGSHPADSDEAVRHLEALRANGADYLLIPETSFWWLDHYGGLRQHLEGRYALICQSEHCLIYDLHPSSEGGPCAAIESQHAISQT